jgi:myo-inositol-1(or 4)-monophosphatase
MPGPSEIRARLEAAAEIVDAAGPIALRHFRTPLDVANKARGVAFDPVTRADREVESFVRAELARRFPDDGIEGEEEGVTAGASPLRWVLDPIDGTRAFMTGMPAWGILLGLAQGARALAGVMHQPFLRETFLGTDQGAWLRDGAGEKALRTRPTAELEGAILYCTDPACFVTPETRAAFERVSAECRLRRFGGDCYAYALIALGQVDLVIEAGLQPYDILPLIPILEGAGGVVSDWRGGSAHAGGLVVAAANPAIHARALARLGAAAGSD